MAAINISVDDIQIFYILHKISNHLLDAVVFQNKIKFWI